MVLATEVEAPPAKEPEAGAGRGGAASWVQHEQCACPGVPFTLWAVCGFCRLDTGAVSLEQMHGMGIIKVGGLSQLGRRV